MAPVGCINMPKYAGRASRLDKKAGATLGPFLFQLLIVFSGAYYQNRLAINQITTQPSSGADAHFARVVIWP